MLDDQELLQDEEQIAPFETSAEPARPYILAPDAGMGLLLEALDSLKNEQHPRGDLSDDEWLGGVKAFLLPSDLFQASFISTRLAVWQKYFDVRKRLEKTVGRAAVQELLMGSQPHHVHFKNRVSVKQHVDFVAAEIPTTFLPWAC